MYIEAHTHTHTHHTHTHTHTHTHKHTLNLEPALCHHSGMVNDALRPGMLSHTINVFAVSW